MNAGALSLPGRPACTYAGNGRLQITARAGAVHKAAFLN